MLFCSRDFLLFFLAVFSLYWLTPWHRARIWLLLVASITFYAAWSRELAALVCGTATLDYLLARLLNRTQTPWRRKAVLLASISMNLGVLAYFKYVNFFLHALEQSLTAAGVRVSLPVLHVLVPIGISFYTFEAISYAVDVYRRKIPAEKSLVNFLVFILFFPHLIAGPIVRAADFLPQVRKRKRWNWLRISLGLQLCLLGLIKKMAIADRMALFADPVFADPELYRTSALWLGLAAYLIQIYCDFSGYSDLALGTAHLLGYRLAWNFDLPYLSKNVAEFWRRWHISLSSWFRDYLFFPLGGSRGGRWRTCGNLMIVFTLCGFWHGASWNYLTFGALTGVWLCAHLLFRDWCAVRPAMVGALESNIGTAARVAATLFVFSMILVFVRSANLSVAGRYFQHLFAAHAGLPTPLKPVSFVVLAALFALGHAVAANGWQRRFVDAAPAPVRGLAFATAASVALLLAPAAGTAFIYFQF